MYFFFTKTQKQKTAKHLYNILPKQAKHKSNLDGTRHGKPQAPQSNKLKSRKNDNNACKFFFFFLVMDIWINKYNVN